MRTIARKSAICSAAFMLAILLLPQVVVAETQVEVMKVASFSPYESNGNERVNIANESIRLNINTWDPLPEGIFVGGTVEESKMRLKEVGVAAHNFLHLTTIIRLSPAYVSNGVSQFIVRMPVFIDDSNKTNLPTLTTLGIWRLSDPADYAIDFADGTPYVSTESPLIAYNNDLANFYFHSLNGANSVWRDMSHESWLSSNRLYARVIAPLQANEYYLFSVYVRYPVGVPFDIFWHGSDLCSDGITSSHVSYSWLTAPDQALSRNYPVEADLGWSFVFQVGLGDRAISYDRWYYVNDTLRWYKWVEVNSTTPFGAFSFIFEFKTNATLGLNYNLSVISIGPPPASTKTVLLDKDYWNNRTGKGLIVASNPENKALDGWYVDGRSWLLLKIELEIAYRASRMQFVAQEERNTPYEGWCPHNLVQIQYWDMVAGGNVSRQNVFFAPYCTAIIGATYYNYTALPEEGNVPSFYGLVRWFTSTFWVDYAAGKLITVGGELIDLGGVGAVFGYAMAAAGLTMLIVFHAGEILAKAAANLLRMIIDGLEWLGNWLWKIAQWIWKALTWLIDQVIYYGAILLGLLIILAAMFVFIVPVYYELRILGAFEMMARGDYDKAVKELGGVVSSAKSLVGR